MADSLRAQLASNVEELRALKAELKRVKASAEDEKDDACVEAVIQLRGEMCQYLDGMTDQWDKFKMIGEWHTLLTICWQKISGDEDGAVGAAEGDGVGYTGE